MIYKDINSQGQCVRFAAFPPLLSNRDALRDEGRNTAIAVSHLQLPCTYAQDDKCFKLPWAVVLSNLHCRKCKLSFTMLRHLIPSLIHLWGARLLPDPYETSTLLGSLLDGKPHQGVNVYLIQTEHYESLSAIHHVLRCLSFSSFFQPELLLRCACRLPAITPLNSHRPDPCSIADMKRSSHAPALHLHSITPSMATLPPCIIH